LLKEAGVAVDAEGMFRSLALLVGLVAGGLVTVTASPSQDPGHTGERTALVELADGRVLTGTIISIDVDKIELRVDGKVLKLTNEQVRRIESHGVSAAQPSPAGVPPAAPAAETRAPAAQQNAEGANDGAGSPSAASETEQDEEERGPGAADGSTVPEVPAKKQVTMPPDAFASAIPHDLRRSRFRARLDELDAVYPWLVPTSPTQWISCGLLLFAWLSLVVHLSTRVVAVDGHSYSRSSFMAIWYLVTGVMQIAIVPTGEIATVAMLVANPAIALLFLRNLFSLTRGAALVAFAVQLGFLVIGYGVLELVSSLLGSVQAHPA
jgi:hypothetical protein